MGQRGPLSKRSVKELYPASHSKPPAPPPPAVKGIPEPEEWVPEEGREHWMGVAAELERLGLVAINLHRDFASIYADTYAKWATAARIANTEGLIVGGQRGEDRKHPAMQLYRELSSQLLALQKATGLTPSSLARLPGPDTLPEPDDPLGIRLTRR
jgi:P27 family predicted phage terminase small subunit